MVRGLYTAAAGMNVQRNKMNNLTNNVVNAETTGYKKDILVTTPFNEIMLKRMKNPDVEGYGKVELGELGYGSYVSKAYTDFSQGNIENTGWMTDLAIVGDGFFTIETAKGERYSKDGTFSVSADGYLATQDGNYVLGQDGRIFVGIGEFKVSADGTVTNSLGETTQLRIAEFEDLTVLRKEGANLYYILGDDQPIEPLNSKILQGARESSNVDVTEEMAEMIAVYRRYEASQRIVSMTDDSLGLAVNIGRVN